jgi:hypothetical protein
MIVVYVIAAVLVGLAASVRILNQYKRGRLGGSRTARAGLG